MPALKQYWKCLILCWISTGISLLWNCRNPELRKLSWVRWCRFFLQMSIWWPSWFVHFLNAGFFDWSHKALLSEWQTVLGSGHYCFCQDFICVTHLNWRVFICRVVFERTNRHTTAYVEHCSGVRVLSASTKELAIARHLYRSEIVISRHFISELHA